MVIRALTQSRGFGSIKTRSGLSPFIFILLLVVNLYPKSDQPRLVTIPLPSDPLQFFENLSVTRSLFLD